MIRPVALILFRAFQTWQAAMPDAGDCRRPEGLAASFAQ